MFDMILSIVILILAISLSFNYFINGTEDIDIYKLNKNIMDGYTNTKVGALNDKEIRIMFASNKIRNVENTVAQQVIEFYDSSSHNEEARNLTRIFVEDFVDQQMNFNITIENSTMPPEELYSIINRPSISFNDSSIASTTQRSVFSFRNATDFYGPYIISIKIWK